jgi:predicted Zn-dependent protease with MMP-like domain
MNHNIRDQFDHYFDDVLKSLPPWIDQLVEEIPLMVDDYPSQEILDQMKVKHRGQLCGLYTGVPLTQRSVWQGSRLPDRIMIYREGIMNAASDSTGHITPERLSEQIRITVLHELAHHHGFNEQQLADLGYG